MMATKFSAGASSSRTPSDYIYDVFLSFRGEDTRYSFTDHLHNALVNAGVKTFLDNEEIQIGEDLKPELVSAIKASRASIIVLSKDYASSTWCLDELVLILEQLETSKHVVIPIFYHVEPTDVRKQQNSFGEALAKHQESIEKETDPDKKSHRARKMESWKNALTRVANLRGMDAKDKRETEFIDEIVVDIYRRLDIHLRRDLPHLIGMNRSIAFITSWLKDGSSHAADILTIWGMGGIGKTSLAKYVHELCRHEFERSSFIKDIGRSCAQKSDGLLDSQEHLVDDISKSSLIKVRDVPIYTYKIENALLRKKVFLVLDGIDSHEQLDALLGNKGFYPGSKIIITTQDWLLTKNCALFKMVRPKHTEHLLEGLCETESLQLLSYHAFMCNNLEEGYKEVSQKLVEYCEGNPLALEVLGSHLRGRDVDEWEDYLKVLEKETNPRIQNVLQMSFNSLPSQNDKELFKHIACFFVGQDREFVEQILMACGIRTRVGIRILIDRCLLWIGERNELMMHQLLQEMGRDVVRQESPTKPWERSRLCCHEESFSVLKKEMGTRNIQGLILDMKILEKVKLCGSFELKTDAFSNMDNLMLLQLNYVQLNGLCKNLPEELRWLCMHGFPLDYIPPDLPMPNLVALDMSFSNFKALNMSYSNPQQPWKRQKLNESCSKGKRLFGSLKILNLSFCCQLHSLGGFFELPALETLILKGCESLTEVCESIEQCDELVLIDMSFCSKLKKLPNMVKLNKVRTILLDGCSDLGKFPIEMKDMESLEVPIGNDISRNSEDTSSAVVKVASGIPKSVLQFLPASLVTLSLRHSNLVNESFPDDFSRLSHLKFLNLEGNLIVSLPNCVKSLATLESLSLCDCGRLETIEYPPGTLRSLDFQGCSSIRKIVFDPEMSRVRLLKFQGVIPLFSFGSEDIVGRKRIPHAEDEVLCSSGWTRQVVKSLSQSVSNYMYYEFGIFSTFFWGKEVPEWISHRSMGPSISFTMPSSPNNFRGLNLCIVLTDDPSYEIFGGKCFFIPIIIISNITKNHTRKYMHLCRQFSTVANKECVVWLTHWMFGKNEMEDGDQVTITIAKDDRFGADYIIRECGISLVNDDGNMEEDPLGYYRSWSHIIGGDLFAFSKTEEYILCNSNLDKSTDLSIVCDNVFSHTSKLTCLF